MTCTEPTPLDTKYPPWTAVGACAFLLPGLVYFVTVALGLGGIVGPARFLLGGLLPQSWFTPILLMLVVGGPVVTVMISLCLRVGGRKSTRLVSCFGWIAVLLPVVNLLLILFFIDQAVAVPNFLD